ncbi:hypothetical protein ACW4TU_23960 [Streptomyces sp. QTS52]
MYDAARDHPASAEAAQGPSHGILRMSTALIVSRDVMATRRSASSTRP